MNPDFVASSILGLSENLENILTGALYPILAIGIILGVFLVCLDIFKIDI